MSFNLKQMDLSQELYDDNKFTEDVNSDLKYDIEAAEEQAIEEYGHLDLDQDGENYQDHIRDYMFAYAVYDITIAYFNDNSHIDEHFNITVKFKTYDSDRDEYSGSTVLYDSIYSLVNQSSSKFFKTEIIKMFKSITQKTGREFKV